MVITVSSFLFFVVGCVLCCQWMVNSQPLFEEPWTISSVNGVLDVFLVDELSNVTVAGEVVEVRVWNQSFTGPLLRCKRGDTVNIYLENKLDAETNLHFHGFHVTPRIPGDDAVFELANNGKIKLYTFQVPNTHPQGLFWYHSHAMPDSEFQIFNGMSGGFVIEGLLEPFPELASVVEKTIMLRDLQFIGDGKIPSQADFVGEDDTTRLVNNEIFPNLTCPPNEMQLWNMANIGADITYLLAWEGPDGTFSSEIDLWLVAVDGILLSQKVPIVDQYVLGPANRAQILVRCPSLSGIDIRVVSRNFTNGIDPFPYTDLIRVDVTGIAANNISSSLTMAFPQHHDYRQSNITGTRTILFSQNTEEEAEGGGGEEEEGSFFINNKPFSKSRVDVRTFLGSIERWYIVNVSPEDHYFHIHQGHFQVVAINGVPQPFYGYVDTVLVARPTEVGGNVTVEIIVPFDDPVQVGKYRFHCHIEGHADGGMMATIEVIEAPHLDVVFVGIAIPVLVIILFASVSFLAYQRYQEGKSVDPEPASDEPKDPENPIASSEM